MSETAAYDAVAKNYHEWVSQEGPTLVDPTFAELVGNVAGHVVCAVACGAGREARFLASQGATVTGVDLSSALLEIATANEQADPQGITYLYGNAHDLIGVDDSAFDGVVCYMALMDIPDLTRARIDGSDPEA